jgi:UDP:flavonoid glycosyltransferase YjiC (YdhE family)
MIGLFPPWYGPPQPDWPAQLRLTGFPFFDEGRLEKLPADVEEFLAAGDRPLVFMPGTRVGTRVRFFQESLEACRLLGRRGIVLTPFRQQLPDSLPEGIRHYDYLPFSLLLRRAVALIHHGGIGSTSKALAAGVPQVVSPVRNDQPDNGARIERLGVGRVLPPRSYQARTLAATLEALLKSSVVAAACKQWAERCQEREALAETCRLIEEVASGADAERPLCFSTSSMLTSSKGSPHVDVSTLQSSAPQH